VTVVRIIAASMVRARRAIIDVFAPGRGRAVASIDGTGGAALGRLLVLDGRRQRVGLWLGPVLGALAGVSLMGLGLVGAAAWTGALVVLMATWWITEPFPLWLTACLPLVVYPALGVGSPLAVLLQYVDPVILLFLGGMFIAASMQQWGLHRRIALGIVAAVGASPRRIVLGFMLGTAFCSLWISNTATTMMMYPIGLAVVLQFQEEVGRDDPLARRFGLALMLGIAYAASIGGMGTKIGTAPNAVLVKQGADVLGSDVSFVEWAAIGLPLVAIALPLVYLYLVRVAAPLPARGFDGGAEVVARERAALGRMGGGERLALAGFLGAALLWVLREDIDLEAFVIQGWADLVPFGWEQLLGVSLASLPGPVAKWLSASWGDAAVAMGVGAALLLAPASLRPLRMALDVGAALRAPWHLLVLLGGGLALAYGVQQSGLSAWIGSELAGAGALSPFAALLVICAVTVALTEVASNVATASILLPVIAASAESFGLHPAPLMFAATLAASFGFMLPAGTPPNAIVFASGYISVPQMARIGIAVDVLGVFLAALVGYLLVPLVLGVGSPGG
jgi:sodium-dependent dicarboxylate transporter 2/3/5